MLVQRQEKFTRKKIETDAKIRLQLELHRWLY